MSDLSLPRTITPGQPENAAHIQDNDDALLDALNLASDSGLATLAGLSIDSGTVRRGKSVIATEESRTNTAYGTLTTPDQVANVVLPTDGLIAVVYQAMFKSSAASAGVASIFLGANQIKAPVATSTSPAVQEINTSGTNSYRVLTSTGFGLWLTGAAGFTGHVTTGEIVAGVDDFMGGACYIHAAAGTYTVSVQFKASSGSVTAKERKLWVWTLGF